MARCHSIYLISILKFKLFFSLLFSPDMMVQTEKKEDYREKKKCPICKKSFAGQSHLKIHMLGVHGPPNFKCTTCKKTFSHERNLKRHITTVHTKTRSFKCDVCPKSFSTKQYLRRHFVTHTRDRKFVFIGLPKTVSLSKLDL